MNVKITLSVPIDEVESQVNEILNDCKRRVDIISERIKEITLENGSVIHQLAMIEEVRKKLTVVDLKLEDSYSVLKGYVRYKVAEHEREPTKDVDQKEQSDQDTTE